MTRKLTLKPGRDVPVLRGHPWIFSGAIARDEGDHLDEADLFSSKGTFLGRVTVQDPSDIRARVFDTHPNVTLDAAGLLARVKTARQRREAWLGAQEEPSGMRVVFSESDGLPGLIVDRYADTLVVQFLTGPMTRRRAEVLAALEAVWKPATIWERSDAEAVKLEGMEPRTGLISGAAPAGPIEFKENGITFLADLEHGHKTGFYLDQRAGRAAVARWVKCSGAKRVLDVFAYTGGFGLSARKAGAEFVMSIDSSARAKQEAMKLYELNGYRKGEGFDYRVADAFETLRGLKNANEKFDVIIVDPPRLTPSRAHLQRSLRAYKDANLCAIRLLNPGGLLFTFCCSGLVDRDLYGKVVEGAARDTDRPMAVLEHLFQSPDHPGKPGFSESEYLKGFVLGA
ncbi:MAG: class I SAM-dependent rRNA methyltransferase [Kiritimatiellia bacterium]